MTPAALVLFAIWLLSFLYSDAGPYIHVLLVAAVVIAAVRFFKGDVAASTLRR